MKKLAIHFGQVQELHYTNHKGEYGWRRVVPQYLWYGENEHHEGAQWFLEVFVLDKHDNRSFALAGISTTGRPVSLPAAVPAAPAAPASPS